MESLSDLFGFADKCCCPDEPEAAVHDSEQECNAAPILLFPVEQPGAAAEHAEHSGVGSEGRHFFRNCGGVACRDSAFRFAGFET